MDFLRKRLPTQVGRYLQGVQFPARKEELLGRLERNGVPALVTDQLRKRLLEGERVVAFSQGNKVSRALS